MKRKLLSVFLAFCMTLTLVPAASAGWIGTGNDADTPEGAKLKVEYYGGDGSEVTHTRYFDNKDNDDFPTGNRDHIWDPVALMSVNDTTSGEGKLNPYSKKAVITLLDDIALEDTTILVDQGKNVTINGNGHKITCTLSGAIAAGEGGAHVPGMDAISITENSELTLWNVDVEIAKGSDNSGENPTQGIYNDGALRIQNGSDVTVQGVSQNGINGNGNVTVVDASEEGDSTAALTVKNVGGSGIKAKNLAVSYGSAVTVEGTPYHGVTVDRLYVTASSITTKDTGMYGITSANGIDLVGQTSISAALKESDATVVAPIRLENGTLAVGEGSAVTGTVLLGVNATVTGDGSNNVETISCEAAIGDKSYATLEDAIKAAKANDTVKLLQDASLSEKLTIDKAITLEGNNNTITGKKDSADVYIEITGGNVTIQNLKAKDFGGNAATTGQWGLFKVPEGDGTTEGKLVLNKVTASNFNRAAVDVRKGTFVISDCTFDCANESTSKLTKGVLAQNVTGTIANTTITNAETTFTEEGNAWNTNAVETWGNTKLTITGCTFGKDGAEVKNGVSMNTGDGASEVTMSDTAIVATDRIVKLTPKTASEGSGTSAMTIESGYYTGTFKINQGDVEGAGCSIVVKGGYFTADPSAYVAEGKAALPSTDANYAFVVGEKDETDVEAATGAPSVDDSQLSSMTKEEKETVLASAKSVEVKGGELTAAANTAIGKVTEKTQGEAEAAIKAPNSGVTVGEGNTVTVYAQAYLNIIPTSYNAEKGAESFAIDIQPMYRVVASTADKASDIKVVGEIEPSETANAVVLKGSETALTTVRTMTISITLPSGFPTSNVVVKHDSSSGTYYYIPTIDGDTVAVFTVKHGFSPFTFKVDTRSATVKFGSNGTGTTFKPENVGDSFATPTAPAGQMFGGWRFEGISGEYKALTDNLLTELSKKTGTVTAEPYFYTPSSGGGGGGGGSAVTTYTLTFDTNGGTAIAKVTKNKGTTITLSDYTTSREGYTFAGWYADEGLTDKVTSITLNANKTVYAKWTENVPVEPDPTVPFTDVNEGDWFYDAVCYVYENDMMNGVSETAFAPNATTSRAMIVTILYRLEKEPAVSGSSFTDVPSGQWYSNAVAWAAENGIVNGVTATTFAPNSAITREQMAAILYRYAAWKGCDVSGRVDLSGYTDAASVSGYATEAMAWANAEGLITGVTNTTLRPAGSAVRAQAATILMRLCENVLA